MNQFVLKIINLDFVLKELSVSSSGVIQVQFYFEKSIMLVYDFTWWKLSYQNI